MNLYPGSGAADMFQLVTSPSTPFGVYSIPISATDGFLVPTAILQLGIGNFFLSVTPSTIPVGPTGTASVKVTSTSSNGLWQNVDLSCSGLPSGAQCSRPLLSASGSAALDISYNDLPPRDYPFQIIGTIGGEQHQANAVLRVGNFSASLDRTSATLSPGGATSFNVMLRSINHYANSITVFCSLPDASLSCTTNPASTLLGDGAQSDVQLTTTAARQSALLNSKPYLAYAWFGIPMVWWLLVRRKRTLIFGLGALMVCSVLSCGGGGTSAGPGSSGSPPGKTVNVLVIAQAADTQTDSLHQQTVGTIVVTVQ